MAGKIILACIMAILLTRITKKAPSDQTKIDKNPMSMHDKIEGMHVKDGHLVATFG